MQIHSLNQALQVDIGQNKGINSDPKSLAAYGPGFARRWAA